VRFGAAVRDEQLILAFSDNEAAAKKAAEDLEKCDRANAYEKTQRTFAMANQLGVFVVWIERVSSGLKTWRKTK